MNERQTEADQLDASSSNGRKAGFDPVNVGSTPTEAVPPVPPLLVTSATADTLMKFYKFFAHIWATTKLAPWERKYFSTKVGQQSLLIFWLGGWVQGARDIR